MDFGSCFLLECLRSCEHIGWPPGSPEEDLRSLFEIWNVVFMHSIVTPIAHMVPFA